MEGRLSSDFTAERKAPELFNVGRAQGPPPDVRTWNGRGWVSGGPTMILGPAGVENKGSIPTPTGDMHQFRALV